MPAKRELSMRQLRYLLRLHHDGVSAREIGRRLGVARSTIQDNLKRAAAAGLAWPLADDVTDETLETRLFGRAGVAQGQRRRAEPDWAALARELKRPGVTMTILWEEYRGGPSRGLRLQSLLRSAARIRTAADAGDAPASRGRGEGVRRLFRQADRDRRSDDGRDPRGGDFRRRARRLEPHLRRGDLDADVAGLDRRPRAHVPLLRRRAEAAGSRQSEERGRQGLVLRPRDQPHLRRDGGALFGRNPAGAAAAAEGQGESRGRSQIRPDLHSGAAACADVLLARRMQCGDRPRHATHERASHAQPRPEPSRVIRGNRARRPHRLACRRLGVRGMAARPGQSRLSHRGP